MMGSRVSSFHTSVLLTLWRGAAAAFLLVLQTPWLGIAGAQDVFAELDKSVFRVEVAQSNNTGYGTGTAFLINPTLLVTSRHVVENAHSDRVLLMNTTLEKPIVGRVVGQSIDPTALVDLAFIEIDEPIQGLKAAIFGPVPQAGDAVTFTGFAVLDTDPFWILTLRRDGAPIDLPPLDRKTASVLVPDPSHIGSWFAAGISLIGGDSGGPIFGACGRVVGVATSRSRDTAVTQTAYAQSAEVIVSELKRLALLADITVATEACDEAMADSRWQPTVRSAPENQPWPKPTWLPPGYTLFLESHRDVHHHLGWVSSLAVDERWQKAAIGFGQTDTGAAADLQALEVCEVVTRTPCRIITRSSGAPEAMPAANRQVRVHQLSPEFDIDELPIAGVIARRWINARMAEGNRSKTALVIHPLFGAFIETSDSIEDATATALAACFESAGETEHDLCFLYWNGRSTWQGFLDREESARQLRAMIGEGRPIVSGTTTLDGIPAATVAKYASFAKPKALAFDPVTGITGMVGAAGSVAFAAQQALETCEYDSGNPCQLIASNNVALQIAERQQVRPQKSLNGVATISDLPFLFPFFSRQIQAALDNTKPTPDFWTLTLHPHGAIDLRSGSSQAEADAGALAACREAKALQYPDHCAIVLRGDGQPGPPMRSPTPGVVVIGSPTAP